MIVVQRERSYECVSTGEIMEKTEMEKGWFWSVIVHFSIDFEYLAICGHVHV